MSGRTEAAAVAFRAGLVPSNGDVRSLTAPYPARRGAIDGGTREDGVDLARREDPRLRDVLVLAVAVGGLLRCITLVFLAMRAVMDVGGACADGGPYVSAQPCPDGATPALLLGVFGGFGFGALGAVYGARVGGYGWVPLLGWVALFATLGWNFLDYGLFNPPEGEGIVWGWLIPGILFELMAWVPVWFGIVAMRERSPVRRGAGAASVATGERPARAGSAGARCRR